ncbi:YoaK family protein [Aspergillus homomorphus CBS 101889]|uniref:DUF1275 domain protein n=1 Tax=Aspergillus homomorphus (strain CBS 101889) TaxID=1450537 RepID=A0A395HWX4_ASPHC|nr:hypothetical protein BO97DRAFT_405741 [Aspergillus homomorphus CBS 101889]RAL12009.1 hypothetical protein BO97DRAFT_405741 [Aspergillus homomorphus CBS 101889]
MARSNMPYHQFPAHERDSLLGRNRNAPTGASTTTTPWRLTQLKTHLHQPVSRRYTDLILLICYIITGLLDSSAVFIWGSFVSMQTGNTVYAGLGLLAGVDQASGDRSLKALISITSFCGGSFFFACLHRHLFGGPRVRGALALSFALQTLCIAVAAVITGVYRPPRGAGLGWTTAVPLALVAFQGSGQAVASRVLQFSALTSVVLTSIYCDLFSAPVLGASSVAGNPDEWRRLGAVLALVVGVVMGGFWAKSEVGLQGALWTAVGLKAGITVTWLWWREEKVGGDEEEEEE